MKNYLIDHADENRRLDFQNTIDVYNLDKELAFFEWNKNSTVLDAGCGNGNVVEKLLTKGLVHIHGVDFSASRIEQVSERFKDYKNLKFFQKELHQTGLNENSYDQIICRYVFEHVNNPKEIINEFNRVLKKNGSIAIINFDDIFFNFYTKNETFNKQLKELKSKVPQDFEIARKIPQLLKACGFREIVWEAESFFFKDQRLEMEMENNKMRLSQGRPHLSKYFNDVDEYDQFAKTYIEEMQDEHNVMSVAKYMIKAIK